jgi:hypothetical protein
MQKLSKEDIKRIGELEVRIRDSYADLEQEHVKLVEAVEAFNASIAKHNEIIEEASGVRDDLVREMEDYFGGRSEKWQEGNNGQAYSEWKDAWEGLELDPMETVELPDLPESAVAEALEQAPQEPGTV